MLTEEELRHLLDRYLEGNASEDEQQLIERWFESSGNRRREGMELSAAERQALLAAIHERMPVVTRVRRFTFRPLWRAAAFLGGVLCLGYGIWSNHKIRNFISGEPSTDYVEIRTGQGEVKQVFLPDSSEVWMNANSDLRYATDFDHRRAVRLNGEAIFDVRHNASNPLTVETSDGLRTKVLGTQFDVRSYSRFPETKVSVLQGKIQVSRSQTFVDTLIRQQVIRYNKTTGTWLRTQKENTDLLLGWRKGQWNFENMDYVDLEVLLANEFGVTVQQAAGDTASLRTHVSVNLLRSQGAEGVVSIFCALANCKYHWIDNKNVELR